MQILCFNFILVLVLASCRLARTGSDPHESRTTQPIVGSSGGDQAANSTTATGGTPGQVIHLRLDDGGNLLDRIALQLDYFPPPRPDGAAIPSCHPPLEGDVIIGRLSCAEKSDIAVDISASQVLQQCLISSPTKTVAATRALSLPGCKGTAALRVYERAPPLKIMNL